MSSSAAATTSGISNIYTKHSDRARKLKELHARRNEARMLNHQEVVEEDRRAKLPSNFDVKQRWAQHFVDEARKKQEACSRGEDYDRAKLLEVGAEEAQRWERAKRKKNPDLGFSNYEDAAIRQYKRLSKAIKPDMEAYNKARESLGEAAFYPGKDTILQGLHKDSKESLDRLAQDVEKQAERHAKFSRRRRFNDDADVNYINERNMKFNRKLERFYGKYTTEIKQNLERGTAV